MAAANLKELRKKRERAEKQATHWEAQILHAAKKLKTWRRREKLYTTLIEKILAEQKNVPKDPTRVVEI